MVNKELYLANMWPQIITKRGVNLFEKSGLEPTGNWLDGNVDFSRSFKIIYPYADFGKPIIVSNENDPVWTRIVSYILFPDSLVGWSNDKNKYSMKPKREGRLSLEIPNIVLSHSDFSSNLAKKTYGDFPSQTLPLGVDVDSIGIAPKDEHKRLRVAWNHMWRSDKGAYEAFTLVADLARKYPQIDFWIGQENSWGDKENAERYQELCKPQLQKLQDISNVTFFKRAKHQETYWQWLRQIDISFSTSFHEGFGLSMMEQEAAGIACVVPNEEAYSEFHLGCFLVERKSLFEAVATLIENPIKMTSISQSCKNNASKYDTARWVNSIKEALL